MKWLVFVFALSLLLSVSVALAERPAPGGLGIDAAVSPGELKATPDMWFYDQTMRQYKDPKAMVRANAEWKAAQRMHRLESMKWFGFSNSRPTCSSDPFHGDYSPRWCANPGYYPARWNGVGPTAFYRVAQQ